MSVPKTWKIYIATSKVPPTPPKSNLFITSVSLRILRAATFGFPTFVTLDSVPVVHLSQQKPPKWLIFNPTLVVKHQASQVSPTFSIRTLRT